MLLHEMPGPTPRPVSDGIRTADMYRIRLQCNLFQDKESHSNCITASLPDDALELCIR